MSTEQERPDSDAPAAHDDGRDGARRVPSGSLAEVTGLFFKLGVIGFGGPTAHIALMEEEAVRRRKWIDRQHFLDALAATNLIPGPNSTEMAIHLGYLRAGRLGGVISGLAFILPAFVMLLALSWAYRAYGTIPEVGAVFAGLKPVVVAIIVIAAYRLAVTGITDWRLLLIGLASMALTLAVRGGELVALLAAGLLGIWLYGPPGGRFRFPRSPAAAAGLLLLQAPATSWTANLSALPALIWVFLKAGALLFGGGYVLIPLIEGDAVEQFGWLTHQQFLDGVALGQTTPGPIVTTATFVGYMAASWVGAVVATIAVFLPSFVFVLFGTGPFLARIQHNAYARAFLKGVSAAVVGAIAAASVPLAAVALSTPWSIAVCAVAAIALARFKIDALWLIAAGAVVGFILGR